MGQVFINIRFKVHFSKYKNINLIIPLAKNGDIVSVLTHDHGWTGFVLILFMRPLGLETKIMCQVSYQHTLQSTFLKVQKHKSNQIFCQKCLNYICPTYLVFCINHHRLKSMDD